MLRSAVAKAACGMLATVAIAGCFPDSTEQARREAAEIAREEAHGAQESVTAILASSDKDPDPGEAPLLVRLAETVARNRGTLLAQAMTSDGDVRLDAAFFARGQAQDGFYYDSVRARLCVRITGTPGSEDPATMSDLECPAGADRDSLGRQVDMTIKLDD